jgi:D-xylonolactonase
VAPELRAASVWNAHCLLGEGCLWDADRERLLFVDIKRPAIMAWTPSTGRRQHWPMPEMIGWLVPRARGGWIAGLASGVAWLVLDEEGATQPTLHWLHRLHDPDSPMRLNDAKADAQGRLWFGTMNNLDEHRRDGRLYRLDVDGTLHQVDEGYAVANGPTFSIDGRTLFHTDSVERCIYAFDVAADGSLQRKRVWLRVDGGYGENGFPDGMCTDGEDHLWVARWGAGCVTRLDPEGREVTRISTGAPLTTNCTFGGPALQDLYITSASVGLDEAARSTAPRSGALFVVPGAGSGLAPGIWRG